MPYIINRPNFQCESHPSNAKTYVNGCCQEDWCNANLTLDTSKLFDEGSRSCGGGLIYNCSFCMFSFLVFCLFLMSLFLTHSHLSFQHNYLIDNLFCVLLE